MSSATLAPPLPAKENSTGSIRRRRDAEKPVDSSSSSSEVFQDDYTFENQLGWRSYRILRPGRGMYHDIKRRLPYYRSDITDAFTYRTINSTVRMYFVK